MRPNGLGRHLIDV